MDAKSYFEEDESYLDAIEHTENTRPKKKVKMGHNAENSELNFSKQYLERYNACNTELVNVDKGNGSANKAKQKYVKIEYQSGLFELMKKHMVETRKENYRIEFIKDPKIEVYGKSKAEKRLFLDLKFSVEKLISL